MVKQVTVGGSVEGEKWPSAPLGYIVSFRVAWLHNETLS
jgi:hypothetical protein